jgi:hypothetical protein
VVVVGLVVVRQVQDDQLDVEGDVARVGHGQRSDLRRVFKLFFRACKKVCAQLSWPLGVAKSRTRAYVASFKKFPLGPMS